jgi:hypothetical protein
MQKIRMQFEKMKLHGIDANELLSYKILTSRTSFSHFALALWIKLSFAKYFSLFSILPELMCRIEFRSNRIILKQIILQQNFHQMISESKFVELTEHGSDIQMVVTARETRDTD